MDFAIFSYPNRFIPKGLMTWNQVRWLHKIFERRTVKSEHLNLIHVSLPVEFVVRMFAPMEYNMSDY